MRERFYAFLQHRDPRLDQGQDDAGTVGLSAAQHAQLDYGLQIQKMVESTDSSENNKSTIYVDFAHINDYDRELAEALELEYFRCVSVCVCVCVCV